MYPWQPSLARGGYTEYDVNHPMYGFMYDKTPAARGISAPDPAGFAQFQPALLDHKNETPNIEYNPMDVFNSAMRLQAQNRQPRGNPPPRASGPSGFQLFNTEMRPFLQMRYPDLVFGEITRMIGQKWSELPAVEQATFCQRARALADQRDDRNQEMYFGIGQNSGQGIEAIGIPDGPSQGFDSIGHFHP
jgi:hypothetical protein